MLTKGNLKIALYFAFGAAIGAYFIFRESIETQVWWVYAIFFAGAIVAHTLLSGLDRDTVAALPGILMVLGVLSLTALWSERFATGILFVFGTVGWMAAIGSAILDATVFRKLPDRAVLEEIQRRRQVEEDRRAIERGRAILEADSTDTDEGSRGGADG